MHNNYSPLRYPGGKNKFYNIIESYITKNNSLYYAEAFAGGSSLALKLLINNKVKKIFINDLDKNIYSFWYSVLNFSDELIHLIKKTEITLKEREKQKQILLNSKNILEIGFATLFLNRTNFSGIIKGGPIGGLHQTGKYKIDCRFNKVAIIEKINIINHYKNNIIISNLDAKIFIHNISNEYKKEIFIYIDPPYFVKGKDLYMNFFVKQDHIDLEEALKNIHSPFLISYDDNIFIRDLYKNYIIESKELFYSAGVLKKQGNEILIYKKT
jgi:DNA adenine methylase